MSQLAECEAYHCTRTATKEVVVSAGRYGSILLRVCESCVSKFSNHPEKNKLSVKLLGQGEDYRSIVSEDVQGEI